MYAIDCKTNYSHSETRVFESMAHGDFFMRSYTTYPSYLTNMQAIQNNFALTAKQNAELKEEIKRLNEKIDKAQETINQNNVAQLELKLQLANASLELKSLDSSVSQLSTRLQSILAFIPAFTRQVTKYFVRLIGTQTAEFEELPTLEHNS